MDRLKAFIVEDEENNREYLFSLLGEHFSNEIDIVGSGSGIRDSIEFLLTHKVDVLFLDIELADGQVFDLLSNIQYDKYKLVFITGYSDHAIRAIKFSAVDYLLKPIDTVEFISAVKRVMSGPRADDPVLDDMISRKQFELDNYLVVHNRQTIEKIQLENISHIEADGAYSIIHHDMAKTISSKSIGVYEDVMPSDLFFRCHKSFIVNRNFIRRIGKGRVMEVILQDRTLVQVASRKKEEFNLWFLGKV